MTGSHEVEVRDNPSELRYELVVDGELGGTIRYGLRPGAVALVLTDVAPRLEGAGLAGRLVAGALDDLRARGLSVVPVCPFVREYIDRHPEYRELVVADTELGD
jgi:uncharacterized protein